MSFSTHHLADGESVLVDTRPHGRVLLWPATAFVLASGATSFTLGMVTAAGHGTRVGVLVLGTAALLVLPASVLPWLRWLTTRYVVTDRRLIVRLGTVRRQGHDVPLSRVTDVWFGHGPLGRLLGCGTVVVECGSGRERVVLADVPHVEAVQREINRLAGHRSPGQPRVGTLGG